MSRSHYEIRVCENPVCGLRYPLVEGHPFGTRCPLCLGSTKVVLTRPLAPEPFLSPNGPILKSQIRLHALLDNVRSAWNVGAMFRTADGLGVKKLYLCGITPLPENAAVRKTSLGAEEFVWWEYARDALKLAERLKAEGFVLWGLEQDARAVRLGAADWTAEEAEKRMGAADGATEEAEKRMGAADGAADWTADWTAEEAEKRMGEADGAAEEAEKRMGAADGAADGAAEEAEKRMGAADGTAEEAEKRMVLVVGNEVTGIDPDLLDLCDKIVYIPMRGSKRSLNVEVAFAIAAWVILQS